LPDPLEKSQVERSSAGVEHSKVRSLAGSTTTMPHSLKCC